MEQDLTMSLCPGDSKGKEGQGGFQSHSGQLGGLPDIPLELRLQVQEVSEAFM